MPTVTEIKQQKRSGAHYSVYLDGVYAFSLTDLELSTSGLKIGRTLSAAEISAYQGEAEKGKAYGQALRLIGLRTRSRREMSDYLLRKDHSEEVVEATLVRLTELGLLDDQAFSTSWIANRQVLRPRSRRRLQQELLAKGVSRDDMAGALQELDPEVEIDTLVEVIRKKQRLPQYRQADKLLGYLARQGYQFELIKKALERLDETSI